MGLFGHEKTLCPGCGNPKRLAWDDVENAEDDGWWDQVGASVCHPCTVRGRLDHDDKSHDVTYRAVGMVRPEVLLPGQEFPEW